MWTSVKESKIKDTIMYIINHICYKCVYWDLANLSLTHYWRSLSELLAQFGKYAERIRTRHFRFDLYSSLFLSIFYLFLDFLKFYCGKIYITCTILTIFKCMYQWQYVHSHCCTTIPTIPLQSFFMSPLSPAPGNHHSITLPISVNVTTLGTLYKWDYIVVVLLCVVYFT